MKTFVNEISVRSFLPFTDCFFPLRVVSFCFHAPRDSSESRLLLYRSQLIKKLAHANSKVTLREMRVRKGRGGGVGSNAYFSRPTLLPRRPTTEPLPGVLGNTGTVAFIFREQGIFSNYFQGTGELLTRLLGSREHQFTFNNGQ